MLHRTTALDDRCAACVERGHVCPNHVLYPAIMVFYAIGVFSISNATFDVYLMALIAAVLLASVLLPAIRKKREATCVSGS